jgi:hypothetical protein
MACTSRTNINRASMPPRNTGDSRSMMDGPSAVPWPGNSFDVNKKVES